MATHSSTLSWKIPWMEEPGRLQSMALYGYLGFFQKEGMCQGKKDQFYMHSIELSFVEDFFFLPFYKMV